MKDESDQQVNTSPNQVPVPEPYPNSVFPDVPPAAYGDSQQFRVLDPQPAVVNAQEPSMPPVAPVPNSSMPVSPAVPSETSPYLVPPKKSKFSSKIMITAGVVIVGLVAAGILAYIVFSSMNQKDGGIAVSCTPIKAGSLDNATARKAYKNFVAAVKKGDQACVDQLSSTILKKVESQTYAASDGNWINKDSQVRSAVDDIRDLPGTLESGKINTEDYTRADYTAYKGLEKSDTASGITVQYPLKSGGKTVLNVAVSFVSENNKILADNIRSAPQGLDNF